MSMPFFTPGDDPGSSFPELLRRTGLDIRMRSTSATCSVPHATTCVAMRFADGVVMAGDRRATSGNLISHRGMEKVVQADHYSGVAIAGAAGPAMEMIKLFQLQLEHYEKVEGSFLSLEGKANQLSMMVRGNLPAAMQGMVVVPIFAGYDVRRRTGRLFTYDVTGGRYEEQDYVATGSGSLHAGTVIKIGYRESMTADDAVALACQGCGRPPTPTRRPAAPMPCAASTRSWPPSRPRAGSGSPTIDLATVFEADRGGGASTMSMPFYVAPEQIMKDRADYARKGIARGRALVAVHYADGIALVAENPSQHPAQDQRDLRPHRLRRCRQVQRVRPAPRRRCACRRSQGLPVLARRRRCAQPRQPVRADPRPDLHPRDEADGGRDPRRRGRRHGADDDQLFHILYDGTVMDERRFSVLGGDAEAIAGRLNESYTDDLTLAAAVTAARRRWAGPDRSLDADDLEVAVLSRIERPALLPAVDRRRRRRDPGGLDADGPCRRSQQRRRRGLRGLAGRPRRELMEVITSANIACGFHAGDPTIIRRTCEMAVENGVAIGAHVSYPDLAGFGRRFIDMEPDELPDAVVYQLGALDGCRPGCGLGRSATSSRTVRCTTRSFAMSRKPRRWPAAVHVVRSVAAGARSAGHRRAIERAAAEHGLTFCFEGFADRGYTAEGTLVPRGQPGALLDRRRRGGRPGDRPGRAWDRLDLRAQRHAGCRRARRRGRRRPAAAGYELQAFTR